MRAPLRGRLTVGRLALDQVVKVRILAPQLYGFPGICGFVSSRGDAVCRAKAHSGNRRRLRAMALRRTTGSPQDGSSRKAEADDKSVEPCWPAG